MTRLQILLQIYAQYNAIYTALIMVAAWAGVAGHLVLLLSETKWRMIIPIYWSLVIAIYAAGIVFVGLVF